jgi:hypothetical protein
VRVRRSDAAELNEIRDGALTYDALIALAMDLQSGLEQAASASGLPDDVDFERVDTLAVALAQASE